MLEATDLVEAHAWLAVLAEAGCPRPRVIKGPLAETAMVPGSMLAMCRDVDMNLGKSSAIQANKHCDHNLLQRLRIFPLEQQTVDHLVVRVALSQLIIRWADHELSG
jgi:hypothetical protein